MSEAARQRVLRHAALASTVDGVRRGLGVLAVARRPGALPAEQPHDGAGQPRRGAPAEPGRPRRRAHRPGAAGLPDVDSGHRVGVDIRLGKTDARVHRGAGPALRLHRQPARGPDRQGAASACRHGVRRGRCAARSIGLLPILVWLLVGAARRRELLVARRHPPGALAGVRRPAPRAPAVGAVGRGRGLASKPSAVVDAAGAVPGRRRRPARRRPAGSRCAATSPPRRPGAWSRARSTPTTRASCSTPPPPEDAAGLDLRQPEEGETVVALVSDRHDNIGMDAVARAIADAGGATAVFDAGDDTSSGKSWEAFSLDSVTAAFEDLDRWGVAGNHDHGTFVRRYLDDQGWTMLDGEVVDGPAGTTLLGVDDPRSSGLGSWRDETGLSFEEVGSRIADAACAADERVAHDPRPRREPRRARRSTAAAWTWCSAATCTSRSARPASSASNGQAGYSYTTGTTGGAAYAFAAGQQAAPRGRGHAADLPRRPARRPPAGHPADRRPLRGRRLPPAAPQPAGDHRAR